MSTSVSTKKKRLGAEFLKQTSGIISGAVGEYFSDAMPTITSGASEVKNTMNTIGSALSSTTQSIFPKLKQLSLQKGFKNISDWYMQRESELDSEGNISNDLVWDDPELNSSEIAEVQISESEKNANAISRSVIEGSHRTSESILHATANISSSLDKQSAIISSGFEKTNDILSKILEVVTKNTSTLIETTAMLSSKDNEEENKNSKMVRSGRFNLKSYKDIIKDNFHNSEIGSYLPYLDMLKDKETLSQFLTPQNVVGGALQWFVNKKNPNLKKNLNAIDDVVNDTIMQSLIRVGQNSYQGGFKGIISQIFGLDSSRKNVDTSRSTFEVKSTAFDTITRESITNTIPGYLRKILVALGGEDVVYDYRSRAFRSQSSIHNEFKEELVTTGHLGNASNSIRKRMQNNSSYNMFYDLLINDLSDKTSNGEYNRIIGNLNDPNKSKEYFRKMLRDKTKLSKRDRKSLNNFQILLANAINEDPSIVTSIGQQVSKNNINRYDRASKVFEEMDQYNIDVSGVTDSVTENAKSILAMYGRQIKEQPGESKISSKRGDFISGVDYTNKALYEIYRKLNDGINVFQTGSSSIRTDPYKRYGDDVLGKPASYKPKQLDATQSNISTQNNRLTNYYDRPEEENLLLNNESEDGTTEDLTKGQRFARWGKKRGRNLANALFHGSSADVKDAFGAIIKDVADVSGKATKSGISKINDQFGNVSGYLKHKLFGTGYEYDDTDAEGKKIKKVVAENEKGGMFGFVKEKVTGMFEGGYDKTKKWFADVSKYFDYSGDDPDEKKVEGKRKKLLATSVGAFAGAGILGGPIGLLVGGIAGNALSGIGLGKKFKDALIGKDKDGNPTGIVNRAADAIISPIRFQMGKTATFIGGSLKKHILGPLSDIGLAMKDRIMNHVDSAFKKVTNAITWPFRKLGHGLGWVAKKAAGGAAKLAATAGISMPGKMARGAAGIVGGTIGSMQNSVAKSLGKNSFHKLRNDETYTIHKGDKYMRYIDGEKQVFKAEEDMEVNGSDDIYVSTNDYLKQRRKNRKEEVENDLKSSGFYDSGSKFKGFFGGDYKAWREKDKERRKRNKRDLSDYTKESVAIIRPSEETAENTSEINEHIADMHETSQEQAEVTRDTNEKITRIHDEAIKEGSLFTHDIGLHERLDHIIEILTGKDLSGSYTGDADESRIEGHKHAKSRKGSKREESEASVSGESVESDSAIIGAVIQSAATVGVSGEDFDDTENRYVNKINEEVVKNKPDKKTLFSNLKSLITHNGKKSTDEKEKKNSLWDIIKGALGTVGGFFGGLLSNLPKILALIGGLWILFKNPEAIKTLLSRLGDGIDSIIDFLGGKGDTDAVTTGMNAVTSIADVKVKNAFDYATPGKSIYHNKTDAAGNDIENYYATEAKEELLWKAPLRTQLFGIATPSTVINSAKSNIKMTQAQLTQDAINFSNNHLGGFGTKRLNKRLDKQLDQAAEYDTRANAPSNKTALGSIGRSVGRIGTLSAMSNVAGFGGEKIASVLGADEATAQKVGDTTTMATSGLLTANMMKSAATGKKSIVDKVLDGIIKLFKWIGEKVGADKAFKKLGSSKIINSFENVGKKIVNGIKSKFDDIIIKKIQVLFAKWGVEVSASAATAGLAIVAGACAGLASGLCSTEHLFGVLPGEADAGMTAISGLMGTLLGALEWSPLGWIVVIFDVIDALLIAMPKIEVDTPLFKISIGGVGIKQSIARGLYALFGGKENLAEKQEAFQQEREWYNKTYGTDLDTATFSDMVNTTGFFDRIWNGNGKVQEDGHLKYDDAGKYIGGSGMKSWFVGKENSYVKDENGNVIRDENGDAVVAVDAHGHSLKKDKKWGDYVGDWFHDVGGWFAGKKTYKTDANGVAMVDENGNYIVESKEDNIFKRTWSNTKKLGSNILNKIGIGDDGIKEGSIADIAVKVQGAATTFMLNPFSSIASGMKSVLSKKQEVDENGKPILDADGNPVKKGGLKEFLAKGMAKITSFVTEPIKSLVKGTEEYEEDSQVPWKKEGFKSIAEFAKKKLGNFWSGITTGLNAVISAQRKLTEGQGGPESSYELLNDGQGSYSSVNGEQTEKDEEREGGNPLEKPFRVTSRFGPRTSPHKGNHEGIDIKPEDGSDTGVASRYNATVVSVKNNVSNNDTARQDASGNWYYSGQNPAGNQVVLKTDDGRIIKNYHLAQGSIPGNIFPGAKVKVGQRIGTMGSTGWSTGKHLHYQIEKNGKPVDPYSSLVDGPEETKISGSPVENASSTISTEFSTTSETGEQEEDYGLSWFLSRLKSHANEFLYNISGGLLGSKNTEEDDSSSVSTTVDSYLNYNSQPGSVNYATTSNSKWVSIVRNVKQAVAAKNPSYHADNSHNINISINGKSLSVRPDCSGIVAAMLKIYGVLPENGNVTSDSLLGNNAIGNGFDRMGWPGWDALLEGDIITRSGHVEIFAYNNGGTHYVYNGGSTSALRNPGPTVSSKPSYQVVWRCREAASNVSSIQGANINVGESDVQIWNYLKDMGYTNEGAAGLMGNLYAESGLRSNNLNDGKNKSMGVSDDQYTSEVDSNKRNFVDGAAYGLAQWLSGGRKQKLYDLAKSRGVSISDRKTQLDHLKNEMTGSYKSVDNTLRAASSVREASDKVLINYEAPSTKYDQSVQALRASYGQKYYDKFAGKDTSTGTSYNVPESSDYGQGGPELSQSSIRDTSQLNRISNSINIRKELPSYTPKMSTIPTRQTQRNDIPIISSDNVYPSENDSISNREVVELLSQVLYELKAINGNTSESSGLLNSLNEKGFQDTGLRNSLKSVSNIPRKTQHVSHSMANPGNSKIVMTMARP